jgi:hypothetical protein
MNFSALDVVLAVACTIAIGAAAGFVYAFLLPPPAPRQKNLDSRSDDS